MASPLLLDIGLLILIATLLAYLARLLRQPLLVAYVAAGVLIGPMGLGVITSPEEINTLAELGVAFLLFTVGLEIDFKRLRSVGAASLVGGSIQMAASFLIGFGIAALAGLEPLVGVYVGLLMAFSSTMIVAKLLVDRNEIKTLHGRIMMGVLLVQDIIVILILPILGNIGMTFSPDVIAIIIVKGMGLFSIAVVLNRYAFKRLLDYAARSHEILFLTAIAICFAFIGLAYSLGFSIAIGAFIGGIALAEFPYNLEIFGEMHSLRDFFSVIFFTSLGMQLDMGVISGMLPLFVVLLAVTILIKPLILSLTYLFMGYGGRTSSVIGLGMGQASEFSFILAVQGLALGHFGGPEMSRAIYSVMVSIVVLSMVITPYFMNARNGIHSFFSGRFRLPFTDHLGTPRRVKRLEKKPKSDLRNHIIVFGCDMMGGKVVDYLSEKRRRFIVAEHNPEAIKELSEKGIYTIYGDADNEDLLSASGLYKARLAIVTVPDPEISGFVIGKAKRFNPGIKIFARAHSEDEAEALYRAGADFVVVPDFVSGGTLVRKIEHFLSGGRSDRPFRHLNGRK
jgi:CPA2 family monovalent cation:H+ antiporter-2